MPDSPAGGWSATYDDGTDYRGFKLRWTVTAPDGEAHYGWSERNAQAIVLSFGVAAEARTLCDRMPCPHVYERMCPRCLKLAPLRFALMALDEHERHSTDG